MERADSKRSVLLRALGLVLVAGLLVGALVWQDRRSPEYGNRLYRSGQPEAAAAVFRETLDRRARPRTSDPYNLGTSLLHLDADEAEAQLHAAVSDPETVDPVTAQRASYNLGYRHLNSASASMAPDSQAVVLEEAVIHLRTALSLEPLDGDARWNLALAQRRLEALLPPGGDADEESGSTSDDEVAIDDLSLARSETADAVSGLEPEEPRAANNRGERQGAEEGAREAWAAQDPGPMSRDAAMGMLGRVDDRPEVLIRGILWSHRPDIAWWESQPYPGGNW